MKTRQNTIYPNDKTNLICYLDSIFAKNMYLRTSSSLGEIVCQNVMHSSQSRLLPIWCSQQLPLVLCVISIFGQKPVSRTQKTLMAHIGCSLLFRKFAKFAAPSLRKFSFLHGNFCHLGCIKTLMDPHFFRSGHGQIGIHLSFTPNVS